MTDSSPKLVRIDPLRLHMARQGQMVTDATIFASEAVNLEPDAVHQLYDTACLPPAKKVLATADIHVGFGVPIGAVAGMDGAIMPPAVGYDINCGMRLLRTPFSKGQIDTDKVAVDIAARSRSAKVWRICPWTEPASKQLSIKASPAYRPWRSEAGTAPGTHSTATNSPTTSRESRKTAA